MASFYGEKSFQHMLLKVLVGMQTKVSKSANLESDNPGEEWAFFLWEEKFYSLR